MVAINKLNQVDTLEDGDVFPIWELSSDRTRGVSAGVIKEYIGAQYAAVKSGEFDNGVLAIENSDGSIVHVPGFDTDNIIGQEEYYRAGTIAKLANGDYQVGSKLVLAERGYGKFDVVAGGSANGFDILNAGPGKTAALIYEGMTPKKFGVIGNGVDDDTDPLRRFHEKCNELGVKASYEGISNLALQADAQITVNTSVDFCFVEFVLLNGINATPSFSTFKKLFVVSDPSTPLVTVSGASTGDLRQGSYDPTKGLFDGKGFAVLECGLQVSNRERNGTVNYEQSFYVERGGRCALPLSVDLTAYQSNITVRYRKSSETHITIKNIKINEDPARWNNQQFFLIQRNDVSIENVVLVASNNDAYKNIDTLFKIEYASHVYLSNFTGSNRPVVDFISSYVTNFDYAAEVYFERYNVIWRGSSSMGNNHVNGMHVKDSTLVRVDCHEGGHNIFVDNCTLSERGIGYGWGGGQIKVTNCRVLFANAVVETRVDYGGEFFGDVIVDGIEFDANWTGAIKILDIRAGSTIPAPVPASLIARNIRWRGVSLDGSRGIMSISVDRQGSSEVYAPNLIEIDSWSSDVDVYFEAQLNLASMSQRSGRYRTTLNVNGVTCNRIPDKGRGINLITPTYTPASNVALYINVTESQMILIEENESQILREAKLVGCGVSGVVCNNSRSTRAAVYVDACELRFPASGFVGNVQIGAAASGGDRRTKISNCTVHAAAFDLSRVASSIGTSFLTGATNPDIPAGATYTTMFTGYQTGYKT